MILNTNKEKNWVARLDNADNFYNTMQEWAKAHDFNTFPRFFMPWDIFVLSENNNDVYCVSLYVADHIAFLCFPLSNKKIKHSPYGLSFLYETIDKYCNYLNIKVLITTAGVDNYKRFLEKNNWKETNLKDEDYYIKTFK